MLTTPQHVHETDSMYGGMEDDSLVQIQRIDHLSLLFSQSTCRTIARLCEFLI